MAKQEPKQETKKTKIFINALAMEEVEIGYLGDELNENQLKAASKLSKEDQEKYIGYAKEEEK